MDQIQFLTGFEHVFLVKYGRTEKLFQIKSTIIEIKIKIIDVLFD